MRKNVAGQSVSANLISLTDGSPITSGTTTVYYTGDGGSQSTGSTATHKGNGEWSYAPAQAETNYDHVAYTFVNSSGVTVTVNVYPTAADPTDSVRLGLTALPNAAADAAGGLPISDAGGLDLDSVKTDTAAILVDTAEIGAAGAGLTDLGGMSTAMKAEVNAEADTALSDYDPPTNAEMEARTLAAASYFDPAADTVATVTDVTNLHASAATAANQTTLLNRIGSFTGSGVNTILGFFQALLRSDATTPSDVGGTYDDATDSLQAIRDHVGDGTSLTEAGGTGDQLTSLATAAALATVDSNVDAILVDTGTDGVVVASINTGAVTADAIDADAITAAKIAADAIGASELAADAANEIADALLDRANAVETSWTVRQTLRVMASGICGKLSGAATSTNTFRSITDGKDRITATVDSSGNRSAVTLDGD